MTSSANHYLTTPDDEIVPYSFVLTASPAVGPRRVQIIGPLGGGRGFAGVAALFPGLAFDPRDHRAPMAATLSPGSAGMAAQVSRRGRPVLRLRPGILQTPRFIASPPWLSATVVGVAHDGRALPGMAEQALASGIDPLLARRAALLADQIVAARIGGACWADPADIAGAGLILVQACADASVTARMLDRVAASHIASRIVLLLRAPAADLAAQAATLGCRVLAGPHDPWPLIDASAELHVADGASIGFLALLAGHRVHCHGPSWLSGWGLTVDEAGVSPRPDRRSLTELAAAALLAGGSHADPFNGKAITAEAAAALAAEWRHIGDANRGIAGMTGMQFWKRRRMGAFLHSGVRAPRYNRSGTAAVAHAARLGGGVASWSSRMPENLMDSARAAGVPVVKVEDGFIRSVGLGSNFLPPCSIILDGRGIYYDPARPSDLEHLLATAVFDARLLARANAVVDRLVRDGITKYNVGTTAALDFPPGRRRVLVPGQVANDLSVRLGGAGVTDNAALLHRVRAANPDAFIVYKPHPDVDAGHRPGAIPDAEILRVADAVVRDVSMAKLIEAIDEVHTLTSLAGFEALLRGRTVVAWGQPFYAGWGLTQDMAPIPRRTRRLSVTQLAAGVLLLYPRYVDPVSGMPCPAETLLDRLAEPDLWRPGPLARLRQAQGLGLRRVKSTWRAAMRTLTTRRQT
jgi:capsular polysaccharide export protein